MFALEGIRRMPYSKPVIWPKVKVQFRAFVTVIPEARLVG